MHYLVVWKIILHKLKGSPVSFTFINHCQDADSLKKHWVCHRSVCASRWRVRTFTGTTCPAAISPEISQTSIGSLSPKFSTHTVCTEKKSSVWVFCPEDTFKLRVNVWFIRIFPCLRKASIVERDIAIIKVPCRIKTHLCLKEFISINCCRTT